MLPCLLAAAAVLCIGYHSTAFLAGAPAPSGVPGDSLRGLGSRPPAMSAQDLAGAGRSLHPAAAEPTSSAFSGATFLPSLLLTARTMVSVCAVVARRAKAPISEYQAPSGVRNFQEMALGFTSDIA